MSKLYIPLNIHRFKVSFTISCSTLSQSVENNTSTVRITCTVKRTGGSTYWEKPHYRTLTISCDGQSTTQSTQFKSGSVGQEASWYSDFTVTHNNDGTKYIEYSGSIPATTSLDALSASGNTWLTTIPRYFSSSPTLSLVSKTETSATFRWTTPENCDQVQYKIGSGSWINVSGSGTSGTYTVSGLSPNTPYTFYGDYKRADSQLWSSHGGYTVSCGVTTYNYPYCTVAPDFTIGNNVTLQFYNPLNRTVSLQMWSNVAQQFVSSMITNVTGTSYTGFSDIANALYQSIPNTTESTYNIDVWYGSNKAIKSGGKYVVNPSNSTPQMSVVGYEDINATTLALTGDDQSLVNGYSTIQVTIPANNKATTRAYAGSIRGYKIQNGSYISAEVPESVGEDIVLTCPATSSIIKVIAIDSRGQSGSYEISDATLINYTPIEREQNPLAQRCDSQGDPNGVGEYVKITLDGTFWNDTFGDVTNSIQNATYQYKNNQSSGDPITGSTTLTVTTTNNEYGIEQLILGDTSEGFDVANSYTIWVTVGDELSTTTFTMTLGSGIPHIAYSPNGVSIMGKYNEEVGGLLQVGGLPISGGTSGDTLPIGAIMPYGGSTIPENWLECNGQAVSRTQYADLFTAIGTAFGSGDGSTTFNLPNFNGRSAIGYNSSDSDFNAIGKTYGNKSISYTPQGSTSGGSVQSHTLTANQSGLPWHGHTINTRIIYCAKGSSDYWHVPYGPGTQGTNDVNGNGGWNASEGHSHGFTNPSFSGTQASLNVVHPVLVTKYIIKVAQSAGIVGSVSNTYSDSAVSSYSCSYINSLNINNVKSCCEATNTSNITINQEWVTMPFGYAYIIGDNFELKNNRIYIKGTVHRIKISSSVFLANVGADHINYIWCQINKNGNEVVNGIISGQSVYFQTLNITERIVECTSGDYFELVLNNPSYNNGNYPSVRSGGNNTRVFFEVID